MKSGKLKLHGSIQYLLISLMSLAMVSEIAADTPERIDRNNRLSRRVVDNDREDRVNRIRRDNQNDSFTATPAVVPDNTQNRRDSNRRTQPAQTANNPVARTSGENGNWRRNQAGRPAAYSNRGGRDERRRDDANHDWRNRSDTNRNHWRDNTHRRNFVTYNYFQPARPRHWINWYIPLTYGGLRYYYNNGAYYRYNGFGFTLAGGNLGAYIYSLPFGNRTIYIDDYPYYYVNRNYYIRDRVKNAFLRVDDPYASASLRGKDGAAPQYQELFVYPNSGQTSEQLDQDKYECHLWAVNQSGFDPSMGKPGEFEEYQRAQCACLEGRGYTVK